VVGSRYGLDQDKADMRGTLTTGLAGLGTMIGEDTSSVRWSSGAETSSNGGGGSHCSPT
jgi:hypothetical protein